MFTGWKDERMFIKTLVKVKAQMCKVFYYVLSYCEVLFDIKTDSLTVVILAVSSVVFVALGCSSLLFCVSMPVKPVQTRGVTRKVT